MEKDIVAGVVIDSGSGWIKAGLSNEDSPRTVFPTLLGHPRNANIAQQHNLKERYIGSEAIQKRGVLGNLKFPIEHGIITDWDDLQTIWQHTFDNELRIASESIPALLLTDPPHFGPSNTRQKMAQICFESFNVPNLCIATPSLLSMVSSSGGDLSACTGLVLDSGDGVTRAVPIYQGQLLHHAMGRLNVAGRELTRLFSRFSALRGHSLPVTGGIEEQETMRRIKEELCYVALDYDQETQLGAVLRKNYETSDGQLLDFDIERFQCPEALFNPNLVGIGEPGIHHLVVNSIQRCDIDIRAELYGNILLSGGSTMFPGLAKRLKKELKDIVPLGTKIKIDSAVAERNFAAWIGGSMLLRNALSAASSTQSSDIMISKKEYEEKGPAVVHRIRI